jgi:nitroreductase
MDVFEAARTMLPVRRYQGRPVPEDVVRRIIEAGRLTGSARNRQPWHFLVVQDRETLRQIGTRGGDRTVYRPGGSCNCGRCRANTIRCS